MQTIKTTFFSSLTAPIAMKNPPDKTEHEERKYSKLPVISPLAVATPHSPTLSPLTRGLFSYKVDGVFSNGWKPKGSVFNGWKSTIRKQRLEINGYKSTVGNQRLKGNGMMRGNPTISLFTSEYMNGTMRIRFCGPHLCTSIYIRVTMLLIATFPALLSASRPLNMLA